MTAGLLVWEVNLECQQDHYHTKTNPRNRQQTVHQSKTYLIRKPTYKEKLTQEMFTKFI